jgi:hypothetical protein
LYYSILLSENADFFQAGIGTYTSPQIATPFASKVIQVGLNDVFMFPTDHPQQTLDTMLAWSLDHHVIGTGAYTPLLHRRSVIFSRI